MSTGSVILVLTWLAIHSVESQFGQEYRSWFGLALRSNPFIPTCQPDGEPCVRMTDCCSNHCRGRVPGPNICKPSFCGCPQPPYSDVPIIEKCKDFSSYCTQHHHCCSGYCYMASSARLCHYPPLQ
ncbi:unnamed protein product [Allacma fusca]|uniref:WAP domain-containing protein n=1 Tax=Allacma fusca TaxID=39272 RepID=A0A8J2NMW8_9HEXA|nr:unnamed protein product [Allacma fusca]